MDILTENIIKLVMAIIVGGVIGAEREFRDKAAGFRTIILITVGSALFTIFSMTMDPDNSRSRVAANIVTGNGFLGAGAIIREGGHIAGLTTAATIWLSAALGMGIGAGDLNLVAIATALALVGLLIFPPVESWIDRICESRTYKVLIATKNIKHTDSIHGALEGCSLRALEHHQTKSEKSITLIWRVSGSPKSHDKFVQLLLKDKDILELDY